MPKGRSRNRSRSVAARERSGRQSRAYKSANPGRPRRKQPLPPKGPKRGGGGFINRRSDAWRKATGGAINRNR